MPEVKYVYAGLFDTDDEWIHPTRVESTWELICVVEGAVRLREEQERYELAKGDAILLKPGAEHAGYAVSEGRTSFFWLHFICGDVGALGIEERVVRGFSGSAMLRQLLHVSNTAGYPEYAADAFLLALLAELSRASRERSERLEGGSAAKLARECAEWVRINSGRKLTVAETAGRFGYNPEYLSRIFRCVYGMTLGRYIAETRIRVACDRLCNTSLTVSEVGYQLGFGSENQFIQFFKYHKGVSPAAFRGSSFNIHMNNH